MEFGDSGRIDLHNGLDRNIDSLFITSTSPGIIYHDLIILGSRVGEGEMAAPGHIRAFDTRTGKRKWIFHTIPQPGEDGFNSWKDSKSYLNTGGANDWGGMSLDENRGIVYISTGSANYDFYGGKRKGDDLFANCVIALDASSEKKDLALSNSSS